MQRDRLPYLILPLAALIAVLPLILNGCSCGHDLNFHILNWLEAAQHFRHGTLHLQWAVTAAYNAGEPRFIFYPPASWTIGAFLGLVFPWPWTPILYTWLVLTAAGLSLYYLARHFTNPTAALLAATFYAVNPYMLFTAYERTAYSELLAAAFIPLLLDGILRKRVTIPRIAIPVALLWLTNAPAAVMSCYALALLTLIRLFTTDSRTTNPHTPPTSPSAPSADPDAPSSRRSLAAKVGIVQRTTALNEARTVTTSRAHVALCTAGGTALGLGLSAFYLLPAAYERPDVQIAMAIIPGMRIHDNFLFHHTGITPDDLFHDTVLHTASLIATLLITLTIITLVIAFTPTDLWPSRKARRSSSTVPDTLRPANPTRASKPLLLSLAALTIFITLLLTPISAPVWSHAPELAFLQFPWRLLAIQAAVLSLTLAVTLRSSALKPAATAAIAIAFAAAVTYPAYRTFHQPCDPDETVPAQVALFHSAIGTEPTDEYTPITADNNALAHSNPPFWVDLSPTAPAPPNTQPGPAPERLTLNSPIPQTLILNRRDYPTWHITLNGTSIPRGQRQPREDGLIAIPIPAGTSQVQITYIHLADQTIGTTISILSLVSLALITFRSPRKRRPLNPEGAG